MGEPEAARGSPLPSRAIESASAALRQAAGASPGGVAREALAALAAVAGRGALPDLRLGLATSDADRRLSAILAASSLPPEGGIEELRAIATDATRAPLERGAAAVVSGILGDASVLPALKAIAANRDEKVDARTGALLALALAGGDPGVEVLSDIFRRNREPRAIRLAAAFALGRSGDRHAVPALAKTLRGGESADLRRAAAASLGAVAVRGAHPLDGDARRTAADALLSAARTDGDAAVRSLALLSLAQLRSTDGKLECRRILEQGLGDLAIPALLALGILGDTADADLVGGYLAAPAAYQAPAALACGLLRHAPAKDALRALFENGADRTVRRYAALALGFLHDGFSAPAIARMIADGGDRAGLEAAIQSLGLMGRATARAALRAFAGDAATPEVSALALDMLGRIRDVASERRLEEALLSTRRTDRERAAAARALGLLGAPARDLPPLVEILCERDYDLKGALFRAL